MTLFKNQYRIESARLKGYDYSAPGEYFVTICTRGMKEWFGEVYGRRMFRNSIGEIVYQLWRQIRENYCRVILDEFEVMPNHLHGIIILTECDRERRVVPNTETNDICGRDANIRVSTENNTKQRGGITGNNNPMLKPESISSIIRWFKGRVSFEIHKIEKEFAWHPRFHDHIIHNERELYAIRDYIHNNPAKWEEDRNNPEDNYYWMD